MKKKEQEEERQRQRHLRLCEQIVVLLNYIARRGTKVTTSLEGLIRI